MENTDWHPLLIDEIKKPYFSELQNYVAEQRRKYTVFPPKEDVFAAFRHTPYAKVRVVIVGQDPYPGVDDEGKGLANGLSFSVRPGVRIPDSLTTIFEELQTDIAGFRKPNNGYLGPWADQGVLLLNHLLTVRKHDPDSHEGWKPFTDAIIREVNKKHHTVVFALWGRRARAKAGLIDPRHEVIDATHPSPRNNDAPPRNDDFVGRKPFSKINAALRTAGQREIDWQIPNV